MSVQVLQGDCRETLKTLDAGSVQCVVTSPPYFGLRDYGAARQIGLEQTPVEYVAALVAVFAEVWRVLRDDGTVWLNLGDSYGRGERTKWAGDAERGAKDRKAWANGNYAPGAILPNKQLLGIPWRVAFALQDAGWYLRSDIIWAKPNCMPESVTDRPTRSHEYLFLMTKREKYYYDSESIKESSVSDHPSGNGFKRDARLSYQNADGTARGNDQQWQVTPSRNRRTVWTVPTSPYSGAHFATFPEKLIEPCILAGSRVGDTVLDPFAGSGTTARVALRHQRRAILCELNAEYLKLQDERTNGVQVSLLAGVL